MPPIPSVFTPRRVRFAAALTLVLAALALLVVALGSLTAASLDQSSTPAPAAPVAQLGPIEKVQVYRTMMPDAGPSAFAVRFPRANLAFCYDPVRGGVNYLWKGDFDLSPTLAGKINDPAEIRGQPFYRETIVHPLRTSPASATDADSHTAYRFRGYTLREGVLEFRYTIDHTLHVRERITPVEDHGIRREFFLDQPTDQPLYLHLAPQPHARIALENGTLDDDHRAVFHAQPLRRFSLTITAKQEDDS